MFDLKAIAKEVAEFTDINDHTGARVFICKSLKLQQLCKAYQAIESLQEFYNCLDSDVSTVRNNLDKRLKNIIPDIIWQSL